MNIKDFVEKFNINNLFFSSSYTEEDIRNISKQIKLHENNKLKKTLFIGCNNQIERLKIKKTSGEKYILWEKEQIKSKKNKAIKNRLFIEKNKNEKKIKNFLINEKENDNLIIEYMDSLMDPVRENSEEYKFDFSIVMAYYNRKEQTLETLKGFEKLYAGKYNFEVILVDDNSNQENKLNNVINDFTYTINLIEISEEEKTDRINPCMAYNKGFQNSQGRIIIIQNTECYHVGNILEYTIDNLNDQDFININWDKNIFDNNFCGIIHKSKLDLLGGFDRLMENGVGYTYKTFILNCKYNLFLNIKNITNNLVRFENSKTKIIDEKLTKINSEIYEDMKKYHENSKFNYPRLLFLYWDNSPLSYLNYLTIESFNEYHKYWKIIFFTPLKRTRTISWKTNEQKEKFVGKCYLFKLDYIKNLQKQSICLDKIGFDNEASEVVKSDYFRYYILYIHGGVWSDLDIIYTSNVEEKITNNKNTTIFKCEGNDSGNSFEYIPVGFFLSKPNKNFFKFIVKQTKFHYNKNHYQSIGPNMFNELFLNNNRLQEVDPDIEVLDNTYYLPFQCYEMDEFLKKKENKLQKTTIGIHWFNGNNKTKKYLNTLDDRIKNNFKIECYLDKFVQKYALRKQIALFSESTYPGGGGEEFLLDIAIHFKNKNYEVLWFTLHNWGKSKHSQYNVIEKKYYTQIEIPRKISDNSNYNYFLTLFKKFNINYLLHQGAGHKLICDLGNTLNIPTITFWCFWEEALNIDWSLGLIKIKDNLNKHSKCDNFKYIIDNIDHYYFASSFVKDIISLKYNLSISDNHVFPTLSSSARIKKVHNLDSFNSKYITLLDAHTLKGGVIFSELIKLNPSLNFMAVKTEDEDNGPNNIKNAIEQVNNGQNKFYNERVNNVGELYNKTKILLCPTYLDETFCRVVYESFINKIPVIFSNSGNLNYINGENLIKLDNFEVESYNKEIHRLLKDKEYYNRVIDAQLEYINKVKSNSNIQIIENKLLEIEEKKNKNIGIFTPWCDQGLGIQSRIYKDIFEKNGYNIFIFATKPYVITNSKNLINSDKEWETNNIYRSPNRRLEINNLELDLFVQNYKIKKMIIPEIQYQEIFDIATHLREKYNIETYAIPNIECIRNIELDKYDVFEKVLVNNRMSYNILKEKGFYNLEYFGFYYDVPNIIKIEQINLDKKVTDKIQILHLSGLNGLFRKRTDVIVNIFNEIYIEGFTNFNLNIVIQGNFDDNKKEIFNKPFITLIDNHMSYTDILNLYNKNHISIQISKQEGLGLGFYESIYMNVPVITLDASPHNEIIHDKKNGWLLPCKLEKDEKPENPYTIINQTQIDKDIIKEKIKEILNNKDDINNIIKNTKEYSESINSLINFRKRIKNIF